MFSVYSTEYRRRTELGDWNDNFLWLTSDNNNRELQKQTTK